MTNNLASLVALLPIGEAWPREQELLRDMVLEGMATAFDYAEERSGNLLNEYDARSVSELLSDFERVLGLPDGCFSNLGDGVGLRRAAVVAKLRARGGQNAAYYEALVASLGFQSQVVEYFPFRAGKSAANDALTNDPWAHWWGLQLEETNVDYFDAGQNVAGDALRDSTNAQIECIIEYSKPAHTEVQYLYGGFLSRIWDITGNIEDITGNIEDI